MSRFSNLRLAHRLGAAFGALALALALTAVVGLNGLGKLDTSAKRMSDRDVQALQHLVVISEDFLSMQYLVVSHLYVEDGDLAAQDETAKEIEGWTKEADESLAVLRPRIEGPAAKKTLAEFEAAFAKFRGAVDEAVGLSRQETVDAVEERDGSRTAYLEGVIPVFEGLDVMHDELEGAITGQAAAQAQASAATSAAAKRTMVIVVVVALLAALALAVLVTRSVTRPVALLVERLRSLDERCLSSLRAGLAGLSRGDLTVEAAPGTEPIANPGTDEVGAASVTLNDLIAKTRESLAAYNASRAQLGEMVGRVSGSAQSLSAASQEMATTSDEAGRAVGEIAAAVSDVAQAPSARCGRWSRSRRPPRRWPRPARSAPARRRTPRTPPRRPAWWPRRAPAR